MTDVGGASNTQEAQSRITMKHLQPMDLISYLFLVVRVDRDDARRTWDDGRWMMDNGR